MPRGDGTGPNGFGPMTGRAAGFCAGYNAPGYANPVGGRGGFGYGRGMGYRGGGRGWRHQYYATGLPYWARYGAGAPRPGQYYAPQYYPPQEITPEQEIDLLRKEADYIQNELKSVNDRIKELEDINAKKA